jgi:hypothetical protein
MRIDIVAHDLAHEVVLPRIGVEGPEGRRHVDQFARLVGPVLVRHPAQIGGRVHAPDDGQHVLGVAVAVCDAREALEYSRTIARVAGGEARTPQHVELGGPGQRHGIQAGGQVRVVRRRGATGLEPPGDGGGLRVPARYPQRHADDGEHGQR